MFENMFSKIIFIFSLRKSEKKLHAMIELYTQLSIADKMTPAK